MPDGSSEIPEEPVANSGRGWWVAGVGAVLVLLAAAVLAPFLADQPHAAGQASIVNFASTSPNSNETQSTNSANVNATESSPESSTGMNATDMNEVDQMETSGYATSAAPPDYTEAAKIDDWSWEADPDFGTKGAIKWRVSVKNLSGQTIASAKVDFSAYDADHHLLTTTSTYVDNIPPGETRDEESFADYHGVEATARVAVSSVRFDD